MPAHAQCVRAEQFICGAIRVDGLKINVIICSRTESSRFDTFLVLLACPERSAVKRRVAIGCNSKALAPESCKHQMSRSCRGQEQRKEVDAHVRLIDQVRPDNRLIPVIEN